MTTMGSQSALLLPLLLLAIASTSNGLRRNAIEANLWPGLNLRSRVLSIANGHTDDDDATSTASDDASVASPYGTGDGAAKTSGVTSGASSRESSLSTKTADRANTYKRTPRPAPARGRPFTPAPASTRKPLEAKPAHDPPKASSIGSSSSSIDVDSSDLPPSTGTSTNLVSGSKRPNKGGTDNNTTDGVMTDDGTGTGITTEWIYANVTDDTYMLSMHNGTSFLPPEPDQPDGWPFLMISLFVGLAVVLFAVTIYKNLSSRRRRQGYDQVSELVV